MVLARTVLVRDLRPLAVLYCSKDYGKAKSGEKRISLRKGEIQNRRSVQDSVKQEFMRTYRSTKEYWQIVFDSVPGASRTDVSHRVRSHRVAFKKSSITPKFVIS